MITGEGGTVVPFLGGEADEDVGHAVAHDAVGVLAQGGGVGPALEDVLVDAGVGALLVHAQGVELDVPGEDGELAALHLLDAPDYLGQEGLQVHGVLGRVLLEAHVARD